MRNLVFVLMFTAAVCLMVSNGYSLNVGDTALDFTLNDLSGKAVALSDVLKDKQAVLVFSTTWCPACRAEAPNVEEFYKKNGDKISVIGVNPGETREKVSDFAEKLGLSYPFLLDTDNKVSNSYDIVGVPTIVVVNKDGKILYYGHSMEEAAVQAVYEIGKEIVNSICPVMNTKVTNDTKYKVEYKGQTVGLCCPACIDAFNADPEKYMKIIGEQKLNDK